MIIDGVLSACVSLPDTNQIHCWQNKAGRRLTGSCGRKMPICRWRISMEVGESNPRLALWHKELRVIVTKLWRFSGALKPPTGT